MITITKQLDKKTEWKQPKSPKKKTSTPKENQEKTNILTSPAEAQIKSKLKSNKQQQSEMYRQIQQKITTK